jgi:RNA polymerase sigma-70 factor (ECF subfamily)
MIGPADPLKDAHFAGRQDGTGAFQAAQGNIRVAIGRALLFHFCGRYRLAFRQLIPFNRGTRRCRKLPNPVESRSPLCGNVLPMNTPPSLLMRLRQPTEQAAWGEFIQLYTPLLYYWTRRLGLHEQDADDLVQEVFLILIRKLPDFTYDPRKSFRSWLRTVLMNRWHRNQRRGDARLRVTHLEELVDPDSAIALEEADYCKYLVGQALRIMQAEFEPTTWKACWEYVGQDRPAAEVAAELGVSVAVVYSAKCRVLRRLRRELEGLLD